MFARFAAAILFAITSTLRGAEELGELLKRGDVVALVGGEEMVAMSDHGALELLLLSAMPEKNLKFRCLAWEGDTVFEQRRELNYPGLEPQLTTHRATVVFAQFGAMESLAGEEGLGEFILAYDRLIDRLLDQGKRRVVLIAPTPPTPAATLARNRIATHLPPVSHALFASYSKAIKDLAERRGLVFRALPVPIDGSRDGFHLNRHGHRAAAFSIVHGSTGAEDAPAIGTTGALAELERLVKAKNQLWFHYYRPQNWAFLAGDRTNQPSSRDHRDLQKRWFPEELEQFVPLIEAKEREIWALATQLRKP